MKKLLTVVLLAIFIFFYKDIKKGICDGINIVNVDQKSFNSNTQILPNLFLIKIYTLS